MSGQYESIHTYDTDEKQKEANSKCHKDCTTRNYCPKHQCQPVSHTSPPPKPPTYTLPIYPNPHLPQPYGTDSPFCNVNFPADLPHIPKDPPDPYNKGFPCQQCPQSPACPGPPDPGKVIFFEEANYYGRAKLYTTQGLVGEMYPVNQIGFIPQSAYVSGNRTLDVQYGDTRKKLCHCESTCNFSDRDAIRPDAIFSIQSCDKIQNTSRSNPTPTIQQNKMYK